jgi:hypothetical protein
MLSKVQKPKTKQELIKALSLINFKQFQIYEGEEIAKIGSRLPSMKNAKSIIAIY